MTSLVQYNGARHRKVEPEEGPVFAEMAEPDHPMAQHTMMAVGIVMTVNLDPISSVVAWV